ncbi:MAG TPA: FkbM family methyltransferase [Verrucomicrobiae bacterium]|nr:FkbM family methyltransferase [Verrucomicrobiae bacterium]
MFSRLLVGLWLLVYGKWHLRGSGLLIRLFYPVLPGLKAYPVEVPGVGTVPIDLHDSGAYNMLLRFKLGDEGTDAGLYRLMEAFLPPGAVLWDVGAFAGYISAHFAHPRFKLAAIHAFEPNPVTLAPLRKLFTGSSKVTIHPFALGCADKTMELAVNPDSTSMASLVRREGATQNVPIHVRRGDAVCEELNLPMPDVIKIDVEGFEHEVISGLANTITKKNPAIFFEHIFLSDQQIQGMIPAGYKLVFIGDDGSLSDSLSKRSAGHDAVLIPTAHPQAGKVLSKLA